MPPQFHGARMRVRVFLEADDRPLLLAGQVAVVLYDVPLAELDPVNASLAEQFRLVDATLALTGVAADQSAKPRSSALRVEIPAEFVAPTVRAAYRRGFLSAADAVCPHFGNLESSAWNAGRVAAGKAPSQPLCGASTTTQPRPSAASAPTACGDDGVPVDVPKTARSAYVEGRNARLGGQGEDLNPFTGARGISGARRIAWARGWKDAS